MKLILAIIQPSKLEAVKEALAKVEVFRLTMIDVRGFGNRDATPIANPIVMTADTIIRNTVQERARLYQAYVDARARHDSAAGAA